MRKIIFVVFLISIANAQKRFNYEYFVKLHSLKLPKVTEEMLSVSSLIHSSDLWKYFYQGNSEKLDSVIDYLTIQGFPKNRQKDKYRYVNDTVYVNSVSIFIDSGGDTATVREYKYLNNFKTKISYNPKKRCTWKSSYDDHAIKLYEVSKCKDEKEFTGVEFKLEKRDTYLESIPIKNGVVDSNNIRRYYLTPFDSVVADFLIEKDKEPVFFNFITYNKQNKPVYKYSFDVFRPSNPIINFNYHTYDDADRLKRVYLFNLKNWSNPKDGFVLSNYTEYYYDKLGRKIKKETKVKPDPK